MSAIIGRVHFSSRPVDEATFLKGFRAIAHYGRKEPAYSVDGPVAFGHHHFPIARRRCVEKQPIILGNLTLVADATLDNRDELSSALGIGLSEAVDIADGELILRAFQKWGPSCNDYLLGDYAFAVWDTCKRRLFLSRDHIGTRPLYWLRQRDVALFASDIQGLVAMDDLDWEIDNSAVASYLAQPTLPMKTGFFRGLEIVPAGAHVTIKENGNRKNYWWDPANATSERLHGAKEYAARLRELTEEAVAARTATDLPVGSHMSGGLDSTSVAALAQRHLRSEGRSLVGGYAWAPPFNEAYPDLGSADERRAISEVAAAEDIPIRWGSIEGRHVIGLFDYPIELYGTIDLADELAVQEKASNDNVGVLLSGWGGDEGFSAYGFSYPASLLASGKLRPLAALTRHKLRRGGAGAAMSFLWNYAVLPLSPKWSYLSRIETNKRINAVKYLVHRHALPFSGDAFEALPIDANERIRHLLKFGHIGARMAGWAAHSARKSFRYRYPLTDRRILEFVYRVPPQFFMEQGIFRSLAKRSMSDLPIQLFKKSDAANERARAIARRRFFATIMKDTAAISGIDPAATSLLKERLQREADRRDGTDLELDIEIFSIITALRAKHLLRA